jgi:peptidoglycan/LPS O-acetylase OafA/YrhL
VDYDLGVGVFLYTLFLPNVMNGLYRVGGILNPLWSIGVEEQFYLCWAPALKRFHRVLPRLAWGLMGVSLGVCALNHFQVFGAGAVEMIVGQLRFHYMAAGALAAWALHHHRERFLALLPFASRATQIVFLALLAEFYLTARIPWGWFGEEIAQLTLYAWLIVTVAANPRNVVRLANPLFEFLGTISYGIYMWHMVAVYGTSALFRALHRDWQGHLVVYCLAYYATALGGTVLISWLSFRWFEQPFLRLKERRYASLPATVGSAA